MLDFLAKQRVARLKGRPSGVFAGHGAEIRSARCPARGRRKWFVYVGWSTNASLSGLVAKSSHFWGWREKSKAPKRPPPSHHPLIFIAIKPKPDCPDLLEF